MKCSTFTRARTRTYDVEGEVEVAAHVAGGVLGAAVVHAVVIWTGALEGERPLFVVNLMALLRQLHAVLEPLACRPGTDGRIKGDRCGFAARH